MQKLIEVNTAREFANTFLPDPILKMAVNAVLENCPAADMDTVEVEKALKWLEGYTVTDVERVYSNGTVYVPLFRVKQALEDKAYNGLLEG